MAGTVEKHEFMIVVSPSRAGLLDHTRERTLAALERSFDEARFTFLVAEADLVDGDYMLVPCRGSIGAAGSVLKPQPPAALYLAIEARLAELRFLQPATVH